MWIRWVEKTTSLWKGVKLTRSIKITLECASQPLTTLHFSELIIQGNKFTLFFLSAVVYVAPSIQVPSCTVRTREQSKSGVFTGVTKEHIVQQHLLTMDSRWTKNCFSLFIFWVELCLIVLFPPDLLSFSYLKLGPVRLPLGDARHGCGCNVHMLLLCFAFIWNRVRGNGSRSAGQAIVQRKKLT